MKRKPSGRTAVPPRTPGAGPAARSVTATEAKNRFGPLLERVMGGASVVITRHDTPKAVLMSMVEFEALSLARDRQLDALEAEFDAQLAGMQSPRSRAGMKAAYEAPPEQLGKTAAAAVRRRR